ncbi:hypothetical protein D3C72_204390 [compost metagenome]
MGTRFSRKLLAAAAASLTTAVLALPAVAQGLASPSATPAVSATGSAQPVASASAQADAAKPEGALIELGEGLRIDWTRGVLTLTGLGFSPDRGTLTQRRAQAHQTALADGARRLQEAVNGLRVNGNAFVRDLTAVDESLRQSLTSLLAATPAKTVKPWPDGSVEVSLELPLWGEKSLAELMARAVELPAPSAVTPGTGEPSALVVDGRGTGSQPALAIALKDETGKLVYQGPVTYFHGPDALTEVAGQKPLQLKARRAVGATRADLTLTAEEAKRFRAAREKQPQLPVVILL